MINTVAALINERDENGKESEGRKEEDGAAMRVS